MNIKKGLSAARQRRRLEREFSEYINGFENHSEILEMDKYIQHSDISTLRHCIHVSYLTFLICRKFGFIGFNTREAVRGALVHDMFLYDWHENSPFTFHGFKHPRIALANANRAFGNLSTLEADIILNHMWPLTIYRLPKHKEAYVVSLADKICTVMEVMKIRSFKSIDKTVYKKVG